MQKAAALTSKKTIHTSKNALIFRLKAFLLQLKRGAENLADRDLKRHPQNDRLVELPVVSESKTPLWTESDPRERFLVAGKIENLRRAVRKLDGVEVPAGAVFSFWKQIGRATRRRSVRRSSNLRRPRAKTSAPARSFEPRRAK